MMQIVRHGHAAVRRLEPRAASPLGPRRRTTTVTGQLLPMEAALTSRRNVLSRLTTITAVTRSRPTTTIGVIRSRAPTIRLLPVLIRRRELIPHRAAAIRLRLAPIPHRAAAIAVAAETVAVVGAIAVAEAAVAIAVEAAQVAAAAAAVVHAVVVEVVEAHTAVEVPAHTAVEVPAHTAVEVPAHTVTVKSIC